MRHKERFYRDFTETCRWKTFRVKVETTDLYIRAKNDLSKRAEILIRELRQEIRDHIEIQNAFMTSFNPVEKISGVKDIIKSMYDAAEIADVGPMASVAGAIAESIGKSLMDESDEIIIENGGDIWMMLHEPALISIFSGRHYFDGKIGLKINPENTPCGICTSSGRVGHSFSFGRADAVTIISPNAALADAAATAACNRVKSEDDMEKALDYAMNIDGVNGAIIVYGDRLAARGDIEIFDPSAGG